MDNQETRFSVDRSIEQKGKTPGKIETDRDRFEKLLEDTSRVYGEALRRLAEGEPGTH